MTALTDLSNYLAKVTDPTKQDIDFAITRFYGATSNANMSARVWRSMWTYNKSRGGGGTAPSSAAVPVNTTAGGIMQANASAGTLYLNGFAAMSSQNSHWLIYDRLLHSGNLSGTSTGAQTVGGVLTRNTTGAGNRIWLEIYTLIGSTVATATVSYTNELGVAGRTGTCLIGSTDYREVHHMLPVTLQAGDTGVRSVETVTLSISTGTAGAFGVTIGNVIWSGGGAVSMSQDFLSGQGFPFPIESGACLSLANNLVTTTDTNFRADVFCNFYEN